MLNNAAPQEDDLFIVVLFTSLFFFLLSGFVIYFVVVYRKKQKKNKEEQEHLRTAFKQEVLKTQLEVQEQTLNYVSTEIHDNITQVLSFIKLTLAKAASTSDGDNQTRLNESRELLSQTITDLRDLSKSLSFEHIASLGLVKTIEKEVDRINKSGIITVLFTKEGEDYSLGEQRELVLFRIFQETINNALKHASATQLKIIIQYQVDLFTLTLEDDGVGFSYEMLSEKQGSGLRNMQNRATLIGSVATITSALGKGCCIKVEINPLKTQFYINGGTHQNSIS